MSSGIVFITTPIGDVTDISRKALKFLDEIEYLYCEDTRKTKTLLERLSIDFKSKKLTSLHDHSDQRALNQLIEAAKSQVIGYVSDAGSPFISDPAFPVLKAARSAGIDIQLASGISALIYALEISGLPSQPFHFYGFLPREKGKLRSHLSQFKQVYGTHVFFEGVSRVQDTLRLIQDIYTDEPVVVARELTKEHESLHFFTADKIDCEQITMKGEFVILVHNPNRSLVNTQELKGLAEQILEQGLKPKLASKLLASILDRNSKEIYQLLGNK